MDQKNNKNYVKILDDSIKSQSNNAGKVVIHTMPKRYMASLPASSQAKNTGILILILGFVFLVVALLFLFSFLKKEPTIEAVKTPIESAENNSIDNTEVSNNNSDSDNNDNSTQDSNDSKTVVKHADKQDDAQASSTDNKLLRIDTSNQHKNQYAKANDSDNDGLSDLEEMLLGSSPNSDDTDGDGYHDLVEVLNLYDPASKGILIDSLNIERYNNEEYNFSIFVSSFWTVDTVSGNDSLIITLSGQDQYIQIMSQDVVNQQSFDEWYMESFDVDEVPDSQRIKKGNWNGVINESKLTVYLEHPSKKYIITLNYEIGDNRTLYYKNIFDMMVQSISIIE